MSKSIDDILDELEARPKTFLKRMKQHYWSFHHWIGFGRIWRFKPRFIWQHITRGFPEHHLWSLDHHLSYHIAPRLRAFADYPLHGCPYDYSDKYGMENTSGGFMHWKRDLNKLAFAFEKLAEENNDWVDGDKFFKRRMSKEEKEIWLKIIEVRKKFIQENLEFFGKYYNNLWD